MFLEQVEEVCSVEERQRLAGCELIGVGTVVGGRDEDALRCTLVHQSSIEVADSRDADRLRVPLGLNYDFPAADRIGVECNRVDAPVAACSRQLNLASAQRELFFE